MNPISKAIRDEAERFRDEHKLQMTVSPPDFTESLGRIAASIEAAEMLPDPAAPPVPSPVSAPDPFFADQAAFDLLSELSAMQREIRDDRAAFEPTPLRQSRALVLMLSYPHQRICDSWSWFLRKVDDKYKGDWIDTFLKKFATYDESARSKPAEDSGAPSLAAARKAANT